MIKYILILAVAASAYGGWITMRNTGERRINWQYKECYYSDTFRDWNISVMISRGSCPYRIKYNPETGIYK